MDGGMRTLWDDGLAKVAAGLTSIEELARVLSSARRSRARDVRADSRRLADAALLRGWTSQPSDDQRLDRVGDELRRLTRRSRRCTGPAGRARRRCGAGRVDLGLDDAASRRRRRRGGRATERPSLRACRTKSSRSRRLWRPRSRRARSRRPARPSRGRRIRPSSTATSPDRLTTSTLGSWTRRRAWRAARGRRLR